MSLLDDLDVLNAHLNALQREADVAPATQGMQSSIADIRNHVQIMIVNNQPKPSVVVIEDAVTAEEPPAEDSVDAPTVTDEPVTEGNNDVGEPDAATSEPVSDDTDETDVSEQSEPPTE